MLILTINAALIKGAFISIAYLAPFAHFRLAIGLLANGAQEEYK